MRTIIAVALALTATGSAVRAEVIDRIMAVVGGQPITLSDVNAAMVFHLVPQRDTPDPLATTLDRLVERALILAEVDRYQPPEPAPDAIDERIVAIAGQLGSREALDRNLAAVGLTLEQLRRRIRDDMRISIYLNQRFGGGETENDRRTLVADWVAGLRRRTDVTLLYLGK